MRQHGAPFVLALVALTAACGASDGGRTDRWTGTVDTLPSGHIVVSNTDDPLWRPGEEWQVVEELRIGRADGDGPDLFGRINSLAVDPGGRIWVLEGHAQELRVFGPDGQYIRTVGRKGGGPGEFAQAVKVELGPDGNLWVMDPQNNRHSVFDTAGTYLEGEHAPGGFVILPWPGGFDRQGRYYSPVPKVGAEGFSLALVVHDAAYQPMDTLEQPRDPVKRERFTSGDGRLIASVPFSGSLLWRLSPEGTIWALVTDAYRLFELTPDGDTLRTITRRFTPLPVTAADREDIDERLKWFTDQGGRIDPSKIPDTKPPVGRFFIDDADHIWVEVTMPDEQDTGRVFDIFDPDGRYLGAVRLPFTLWSVPIFRNGALYAVTTDELEVPYVVRASIVKPGA
ncbi:MAG TPA: 6-bladed beta-propeller [Longimicrobiales bacterium]